MQTEREEHEGALSTDETKTLIIRLLATRGEQGATKAEMRVVVEWAEGIRVQEAMLALVLKGLVPVDVRDGEPFFLKPEPV